MWIDIEGHDFYETSTGELVPRFATTETLQIARKRNAISGSAIMGGAFRFGGWSDGTFRFKTNRANVIYRDNGNGHYEIQLNMPAPLNKGNGF